MSAPPTTDERPHEEALVGPIDYLAVEFPGARLTGEGLSALLDLVSSLPLLDTTRIRYELGWTPRVSAVEAMREVLTGMVDHASGETPTLAEDSALGRLQEMRTGTGEKYSADRRT